MPPAMQFGAQAEEVCYDDASQGVVVPQHLVEIIAHAVRNETLQPPWSRGLEGQEHLTTRHSLRPFSQEGVFESSEGCMRACS